MENIAFDAGTRQQIILAAFNAAGPGASDIAVATQIERIADSLMPGSAASRALDEIEHYWRDTVTDVNKPFMATILYVDMEATSQRPVLALRSAPNASNPEGKFELIKLGMARGRNRQRILAQANDYVRMLGHQVSVTRMNEKTAKGTKASMLRSAVSHGQNPEYGALHITGQDTEDSLEMKLTKGAQMVNWGALSDSDQKIASKLSHLPRRNSRRAEPPQGQYVQGQRRQSAPVASQDGYGSASHGYASSGQPHPQSQYTDQQTPWQG